MAIAEIVFGVIIAINGLVFICVGLVLYRVAGMLVRGEVGRKNHGGVGFKIKEAYASDEAWYRINREGGKRMILSSLAVAALGALMAMFGVLVAVFGFVLDTSLLVYYAAVVVTVLLLLVPSCGYAIWVKLNERKRKTA